jgi:hypothetical protein
MFLTVVQPFQAISATTASLVCLATGLIREGDQGGDVKCSREL